VLEGYVKTFPNVVGGCALIQDARDLYVKLRQIVQAAVALHAEVSVQRALQQHVRANVLIVQEIDAPVAAMNARIVSEKPWVLIPSVLEPATTVLEPVTVTPQHHQHVRGYVQYAREHAWGILLL
jgi:hypothetical protein